MFHAGFVREALLFVLQTPTKHCTLFQLPIEQCEEDGVSREQFRVRVQVAEPLESGHCLRRTTPGFPPIVPFSISPFYLPILHILGRGMDLDFQVRES